MDRDRSIVSQNAGTTAANLINSAVTAGTLAPASIEELLETFEAVRLNVFNGTLSLAGAESVVESFEAPAGEAPFPSDGPAPAPAPGGGGSKKHADVEVKVGKHRGKTIGAIAAIDQGWLEWAGNNLSNDWLKSRINEYLAS